MNVQNAINIISVLIAVGALWVSIKRAPFTNRQEGASTIKSLNESVELANKRAFAAEEQIFLLEKRLKSLENSLSYRITFDVILGTSPSVEQVEIESVPERRVNEMNVKTERRKRL